MLIFDIFCVITAHALITANLIFPISRAISFRQGLGLGDTVNIFVDIWHLLYNYSTCLDVCQPNISLATSFRQGLGLGDNAVLFLDQHCIQF